MSQTIRQGFISTSMGKLRPVSQLLEAIGLRSFTTSAVSFAIRDYQRYISPRKGFSCAHRALYGGESCSTYFLQTVTSLGLSEAILLFQQRLQDCQRSYNILKMSADGQEASENSGHQSDAAQTQSESSDDHEETDEKTRKDSACTDCSTVDCSSFGSFNCSDLQLPLGPCDSNHDGVLDFGDCSSADGCDVSCDGIDFGSCDW